MRKILPTVKIATDTVVNINHLDDLYRNSTGALSTPSLLLLGNKSLSCICFIARSGFEIEDLQEDP
jgi:hypothetical protein